MDINEKLIFQIVRRYPPTTEELASHHGPFISKFFTELLAIPLKDFQLGTHFEIYLGLKRVIRQNLRSGEVRSSGIELRSRRVDGIENSLYSHVEYWVENKLCRLYSIINPDYHDISYTLIFSKDLESTESDPSNTTTSNNSNTLKSRNVAWCYTGQDPKNSHPLVTMNRKLLATFFILDGDIFQFSHFKYFSKSFQTYEKITDCFQYYSDNFVYREATHSDVDLFLRLYRLHRKKLEKLLEDNIKSEQTSIDSYYKAVSSLDNINSSSSSSKSSKSKSHHHHHKQKRPHSTRENSKNEIKLSDSTSLSLKSLPPIPPIPVKATTNATSNTTSSTTTTTLSTTTTTSISSAATTTTSISNTASAGVNSNPKNSKETTTTTATTSAVNSNPKNSKETTTTTSALSTGVNSNPKTTTTTTTTTSAVNSNPKSKEGNWSRPATTGAQTQNVLSLSSSSVTTQSSSTTVSTSPTIPPLKGINNNPLKNSKDGNWARPTGTHVPTSPRRMLGGIGRSVTDHNDSTNKNIIKNDKTVANNESVVKKSDNIQTNNNSNNESNSKEPQQMKESPQSPRGESDNNDANVKTRKTSISSPPRMLKLNNNNNSNSNNNVNGNNNSNTSKSSKWETEHVKELPQSPRERDYFIGRQSKRQPGIDRSKSLNENNNNLNNSQKNSNNNQDESDNSNNNENNNQTKVISKTLNNSKIPKQVLPIQQAPRRIDKRITTIIDRNSSRMEEESLDKKSEEIEKIEEIKVENKVVVQSKGEDINKLKEIENEKFSLSDVLGEDEQSFNEEAEEFFRYSDYSEDSPYKTTELNRNWYGSLLRNAKRKADRMTSTYNNEDIMNYLDSYYENHIQEFTVTFDLQLETDENDDNNSNISNIQKDDLKSNNNTISTGIESNSENEKILLTNSVKTRRITRSANSDIISLKLALERISKHKGKIEGLTDDEDDDIEFSIDDYNLDSEEGESNEEDEWNRIKKFAIDISDITSSNYTMHDLLNSNSLKGNSRNLTDDVLTLDFEFEVDTTIHTENDVTMENNNSNTNTNNNNIDNNIPSNNNENRNLVVPNSPRRIGILRRGATGQSNTVNHNFQKIGEFTDDDNSSNNNSNDSNNNNNNNDNEQRQTRKKSVSTPPKFLRELDKTNAK